MTLSLVPPPVSEVALPQGEISLGRGVSHRPYRRRIRVYPALWLALVAGFACVLWGVIR